MKRTFHTALILASMLCYVTALQADTTITYQGRLDSGGQPHTGTTGMLFQLYDQASGGSQQGPALNQSIQVTDGLFQAELDFGQQPYEAGRWLQITVNGQLLSPRQRITGAPFALRTLQQVDGALATIIASGPLVLDVDTELVLGGNDTMQLVAFCGGGQADLRIRSNVGGSISGVLKIRSSITHPDGVHDLYREIPQGDDQLVVSVAPGLTNEQTASFTATAGDTTIAGEARATSQGLSVCPVLSFNGFVSSR